ncbi:hypothetical protein TI01_0661 [Lysobacter sp. A03]|nr:hypothetical protein TI01_0661 [Lysobacter sp. A03]
MREFNRCERIILGGGHGVPLRCPAGLGHRMDGFDQDRANPRAFLRSSPTSESRRGDVVGGQAGIQRLGQRHRAGPVQPLAEVPGKRCVARCEGCARETGQQANERGALDRSPLRWRGHRKSRKTGNFTRDTPKAPPCTEAVGTLRQAQRDDGMWILQLVCSADLRCTRCADE